MLLQRNPNLSDEERAQRHKLALQDATALCLLLLLVVVLSFTTWGLFHSFSTHRDALKERWLSRGQQSLAAGNPRAAIASLHSALSFAPDDRSIQIELAMALAAAGETRQALAYFNTLLETEPGSGPVNLQLARLYVQLNETQAAVDHYETSIEGTWNGDGFLRRREIRLELAQYLTKLGRQEDARGLLLITAGNAPENHPLQLKVAALLEAAGAPFQALDIYQKAGKFTDVRLAALEDGGRLALSLGRFTEARDLLAKAVNEEKFAHQPQALRSEIRDQLATTEAVLSLYPANTLPQAERAHRIAHLATIGEGRLNSCMDNVAARPPQPAPPAALAPQAQPNKPAVSSLGARLERLNPLAPKHNAPTPAPQAAPDNAAQLQALQQRWDAVPNGNELQSALRSDDDLARNVLQLVYDTEQVTATACGQPSDQNALVLRMAAAAAPKETQP